VFTPGIDDLPGVFKTSKPVLVQAAIPELTVERFNKRVLSWLPWLNEMQFYAGALRPEEHRLAGQLRTVVHDDPAGQVSLSTKLCEEPRQPRSGDR
jgi:hypothetical protein